MDAGTWGTMGVGLGYAIAAATARPDRLSIAVEGDSAFGFSGMECETICRYALVRACYCPRILPLHYRGVRRIPVCLPLTSNDLLCIAKPSLIMESVIST